VWQNLGADHLAILPEETPGACDWNMGCGIRAAEGTIVEDHMYSQWLEPGPETDELLRTLDNYSEADRKKIPAEDFAGKNRSFPIVKPGDVQNAAISIGRAGSDNYSPDQLKRRIIAIAYRKGAAFVAQLPDSWKKKKDMKNASVFAKIMDMLRVAAGTETVDAEETAELVAYEAIEAQINGAMGALQAAGDLCADLIADEQENPTETPAEEDAEEMVEDARLKAIIAYLGTAQAGCQSAATLCYAECADKVDPVETASTPRYYSEKAAWGEEKKPCQCKKNLSAKSAGM
jgi:hypothetical protein